MRRSFAFIQLMQKIRERRQLGHLAVKEKQLKFLRRKRRHVVDQPDDDAPLAESIAALKSGTSTTDSDEYEAIEPGRGGNTAARRRGRHAVFTPQLAAYKPKSGGATHPAAHTAQLTTDELPDIWLGAVQRSQDARPD